jgi:NADPH-dependent glutamate synthase beta subunit-like oxidoreductase
VVRPRSLLALERAMADPKGFLTAPRQDCARRPVRERVRDWNEVYDRQSLLPVIGTQAGRCMDCGIPFCHHGCPLGNLIPEWNDLVWRGDWAAASERLHATNNFPEFTGRLCPAPCEPACVLAINRPAVTIKNVEATIADRGACAGDFGGQPPISAEGRHVVIVGGGDTGADCLGTALRQGAASVVQLDINPLPGHDRAPHQPWPVYPKVYRTSSAHQEARELAGLRGEDWESLCLPVPGPDGDVRVFSASTLRFEGDASGHVRAVHLVGVEPEQRRPRPGTGRVISADLVLLALGFDGPDHDGSLMEQLALRPDPRGNFARDTDFSAGPEGVFVAGDAGRGASLVVWAIAEGRAAAAAVDRYLMSATTLPAPIEPTDRPLAV